MKLHRFIISVIWRLCPFFLMMIGINAGTAICWRVLVRKKGQSSLCILFGLKKGSGKIAGSSCWMGSNWSCLLLLMWQSFMGLNSYLIYYLSYCYVFMKSYYSSHLLSSVLSDIFSYSTSNLLIIHLLYLMFFLFHEVFLLYFCFNLQDIRFFFVD